MYLQLLWTYVLYRHTSFYCFLLYCASQMFCFLTNWRRQDPPPTKILFYCDACFIAVVWTYTCSISEHAWSFGFKQLHMFKGIKSKTILLHLPSEFQFLVVYSSFTKCVFPAEVIFFTRKSPFCDSCRACLPAKSPLSLWSSLHPSFLLRHHSWRIFPPSTLKMPATARVPWLKCVPFSSYFLGLSLCIGVQQLHYNMHRYGFLVFALIIIELYWTSWVCTFMFFIKIRDLS